MREMPNNSNNISQEPEGITLSELNSVLLPQLLKIAILSLAVGAAAYGVTMLMSPIFTARAVIISPQQQQNVAASALASLGALTGLSSNIRSPADQYVSIMQSATVGQRIVDRFKLMDVYGAKFRIDALRNLGANVRISAGKKDNLISVDVDDTDPARAADIANAYIEELRYVTNNLALTEAQQRRAFFEQQLADAKVALQNSQIQLQKTGFTAGALKSEPKAAADAYARTKAEIASTEIRLSTLRRAMADGAPEVQQLLAALAGLRGQLGQYERPLEASSNQDYVSAYRDYKYQEALFDIFAKQLELAKLDEAREGTLIQVLDKATVPERKTKPKRAMIAAVSTLLAGVALTIFFAGKGLRRRRATA